MWIPPSKHEKIAIQNAILKPCKKCDHYIDGICELFDVKNGCDDIYRNGFKPAREADPKLVQEANRLLEGAWLYKRKPCPVLSWSDFKEAREPGTLNWDQSNRGKSLMTVCRNGKSYNDIFITTVEYKPMNSVSKSRNRGFSYNYHYYIMIAIDLLENEVRTSFYSMNH